MAPALTNSGNLVYNRVQSPSINFRSTKSTSNSTLFDYFWQLYPKLIYFHYFPFSASLLTKSRPGLSITRVRPIIIGPQTARRPTTSQQTKKTRDGRNYIGAEPTSNDNCSRHFSATTIKSSAISVIKRN